MTRFRPSALPLVVVPAVVYASWVRPRMRSWGATQAETTCSFPGDELVPDPNGGATMATTLPAPPEKVWPWLVQMGGGRGGWYSWDLVDNDGVPQRGSHRARMARPGTGTTSLSGPQGPDELVDRRVRGTEPHPGAADELRLFRPILRSANRRGAVGFHGRDLGVLPERGSRRSNPFGGPHEEPQPPAAAHSASHAVGGRTRASHHAVSSVPQPALSGGPRQSAARLGVSIQRVSQIVAEREDFPNRRRWSGSIDCGDAGTWLTRRQLRPIYGRLAGALGEGSSHAAKRV